MQQLAPSHYLPSTTRLLSLISSAPEPGHQSGKHWLQHADHGVGQVHLHPGEGGRAGAGGDHRHGRPQHAHPQAHLCRQCHHEPRQQGHRT